MTTWVFDGSRLPGGEPARIHVGSGEPDRLPGRFALAGLVDAHAHLTVGADELGPVLVDKETAESRLDDLSWQGVTALRDTGGDRTITLPLAAVVGDRRPLVVASGRFLASAGRYFPRLHVPVDPHELVRAVHDEIDAGATWVKLIGDFPATDGVTVIKGSAVEPAYDAATVAAAIRAAHDRGVRVAAHTNSSVVSELVSAGVDSVEHGTVIGADDLDLLGSRNGAWTPTLCASVAARPTDSENARRRRQESSEHLREMLPRALRAGVRVLAGSDAVGTVAQEISLLVEHGLDVEDALAAASTTAQRYLGVGGDGDLVTYHHDPREDLDVLRNPAAVVVRGVRIR